jgi:sulfite reductase (NADPH) hemoprotein beta-component
MFAVVARVAYASSDVVLSVQPTLDTESPFSGQLKALAHAKQPSLVSAKRQPEVSASVQCSCPRL